MLLPIALAGMVGAGPASAKGGCPDWLTETLARAWAAPARDVHVEKCVSGKFPAPGQAAVAWLERNGGATLRHVVVDEKSHKIVAQLDGEDTGIAQMDYFEFEDLVAADFDHDGTDEIVQYGGYDKNGESVKLVEVFRLAGKALASILSESYGFDNSRECGEDEKEKLVVCDGDVKIANGEMVVTTRLTQGRKSRAKGQCTLGRRVFTLSNGKFAEKK